MKISRVNKVSPIVKNIILMGLSELPKRVLFHKNIAYSKIKNDPFDKIIGNDRFFVGAFYSNWSNRGRYLEVRDLESFERLYRLPIKIDMSYNWFIHKDILYVGVYKNGPKTHLYAIDLETGHSLWQEEGSFWRLSPDILLIKKVDWGTSSASESQISVLWMNLDSEKRYQIILPNTRIEELVTGVWERWLATSVRDTLSLYDGVSGKRIYKRSFLVGGKKGLGEYCRIYFADGWLYMQSRRGLDILDVRPYLNKWINETGAIKEN